MKRFFLVCGLVIALLLSGCGSSASRVETLKSWSFQYNEGTSDYSLFFGLADKNDKSLSADVDVDIRIVNEMCIRDRLQLVVHHPMNSGIPFHKQHIIYRDKNL